jgi:antitoxin component YwqK of YwqJK toxin-antitoxin module
MKGLLTILCLSSSLAGCQKPDLKDPDMFEEIASQAIDRGMLEAKRVKGLLVLCIPDTEKPYSGWVKETHDNGQLKRLGYLNDGAKDGPWTSWHENGRKQLEIRYEKDVMHGIMSTWYPNGQKKGTGRIKDGEMDGRWEEWYENGWKSKVQSCDFGKLISATVWKPDGEKCPVSNVVNGNGELIDYNEDGTIEKRYTIKDGVGIDDSNRTGETSP